MAHFASSRFWQAYAALPENVRPLADKAYQLLERDPRHRSLRFKRVGRFCTARVSEDYRALGIDAEEGVLWVWIGPHSEYERIIRS